ncbi:MAG: MFS transporter [Sphingobacteriaceae bacterium]|nr:MFS transporter [Sphingobacteriaceae bacterium]
MKYITRTIWILSFVSLFTDIAGEMLYPVIPVYLQSIGFSVIFIGILEGIAEATSGLSKGYFGKLSDSTGKRVPFVQFGYALSTISRPLMAVFAFPLWVIFARTLDRFGKGIRTGARDAILSDEATPATKGKVFGFHRSMDTLGAVLGPSLALLYLYFYPENYKTLFFIAFIPGVLAVFGSLLIKESKNTEVRSEIKTKVGLLSFLKYWNEAPADYRKLMLGLLTFTLFNSSDIFLLLKAKESGLTDTQVIGVFVFYNFIYALFAFPLGSIADKIGLKKMYIAGLVIFTIVYFGVGLSNNFYVVGAMFLLYGVYSAATEGISKAWISNICDKKDTATAIGTYTAFQSVLTMIASTLTGLLWYNFGPSLAFIVTGCVSFLVVIYLSIFIKRE